MNCKITLRCQLKWSFYIPLGNYKSGEFSTRVFHPAGQTKNPSFEQNIRTSEHTPAFQMKLLVSFIIPPVKISSPTQQTDKFWVLFVSPRSSFLHAKGPEDNRGMHTSGFHISFTPRSRTRHLDLGARTHGQALPRLHVRAAWQSCWISLSRKK